MENPISSIPPKKPETVLSEIEGENFAKELWFDAYYKGNSLIPQTEEGMRFCLAIATINEDPNMDWQKFRTCNLSLEQVTFLGRAMSDQHRTRGIHVSVPERIQVFPNKPKIVNPERLQDLWQAAKSVTLTMLGRYITGYASDVESSIDSIEYFFKDPKNTEGVERLKKILDVIKKCFNKPETQDILKRYRNEFNQKDRPQTGKNFDWENHYKSEFTGAIERDIREAFNGILPEHLNNLLY